MTTKQINMNFRIKVSGRTEQGKIHCLVGVSGLVDLIGEELAVKMFEAAFAGTNDKTERKLRRGLKITFYNK